MNRSEECPFCDPEIARSEFAGTADFAAVYNIAPVLPGHTLIIPRQHLTGLYELPQDEFCTYWSFAQKVTSFLLEVFDTDAFNWTIQEREAAGQTVPHLHLHLIPRKQGDLPRPGDWYPRLRDTQDENGEIDSEDREHLSIEERARVATELAARWRDWVDAEDK